MLVTRTSSQRFRLVGANPSARPTAQMKLSGRANYFLGNDPRVRQSDIETYQELLTRGVYLGIDLATTAIAAGWSTTFTWRQATVGNWDRIPGRGRAVDRRGRRAGRSGRWTKLAKHTIMYQVQGGRLEGVKGSWVLKGRKQAGYFVADYDRRRELVIDPLIFSTYYGGTLNDPGNGITINGAGNCYITGDTDSVNFPTTAGAVQPAFGGGGNDVFVLKLNPTGTAVLYATYLGGNTGDSGNAIAVDAAGNAYVTGRSTGNYPTTAGTFQTTRPGSFVTKLNPAGSAMVYSTRLSGTGVDVGNGIAVDLAGNAYVAGETASPISRRRPALPDDPLGRPLRRFHFQGESDRHRPGLLHVSGREHRRSKDIARAIAIDGTGNAYVTGQSNSTNFPTTAGSYQPALSGAADVFVTKLNPAGAALVYSTFVGGEKTATAASASRWTAPGTLTSVGTQLPSISPPPRAASSGQAGRRRRWLREQAESCRHCPGLFHVPRRRKDTALSKPSPSMPPAMPT